MGIIKHPRSIIVLILTCAAAAGLRAQVSPHGPISISCQSCHSTDSWRMRPDATFDHVQTGFPLEGQHKAVDCASCHKGLKFSGTEQLCSSCHTDIHKSELGTNCVRCHTPQSWNVTDMMQRHQMTRFPLLGKHASLSCQDCHTSVAANQYAGTPTTCIGCHRSNYLNSANPNHPAAGFSTDCAQCHQVTAYDWTTGFDHNQTRFPLTGAHRATACNTCHINNRYASLPTNCSDCHTADFAKTTNPNHQAGGFPTLCAQCHSTNAWSPATFDHNATRLPLTGKHTVILCQACHANNNYQLVYTDCYGCHQTEFQQQTNPNHVTAGFSHQCQICHSTTDWTSGTFDHATTKFPLTGKHTTTACASCHVNGNYLLVYTTCYPCHQTEYQQAANPNHAAANFSQQCQTCHSTTDWTNATFDHNTTKLPLTGKHTTSPCASCHVNNNYQLVYTTCYVCHTTEYQQTTNPSHTAANFSQQCQTCHSTTDWTNATFDHNTTNLPLTGKHTTTPCASCHVNNNYQLVFTDCYACHTTEYQGATNPAHASAGIGHQCQTCHSTTDWTSSTFNHDSQYFKVYSGAHRSRWTLCSECHANAASYADYTCTTSCHSQTQMNSQHRSVQNYQYSSPACYSCHRNV